MYKGNRFNAHAEQNATKKVYTNPPRSEKHHAILQEELNALDIVLPKWLATAPLPNSNQMSRNQFTPDA
jgi:hypothetical protein